MRRFWIGLVTLMVVVLPLAGCGSQGNGVVASTASTETSATQAPSTQARAAETSTTAAETSTTQAAAADGWVTIATLNSTDSPWQGMEGLLISAPFTISGEAQLVLDMPNAGAVDGVIVAIIPADKATSTLALIDAVQEGIVVTLPAARPTKTIEKLEGTFVVVNTVPASIAWSLELQTRP